MKIADIKNGALIKESYDKMRTLLNFLSSLTEWNYNTSKWKFDDMQVINFRKGIIPINTLNNTNYIEILTSNPLSFAITGTKQMEYTIDEKKELL